MGPPPAPPKAGVNSMVILFYAFSFPPWQRYRSGCLKGSTRCYVLGFLCENRICHEPRTNFACHGTSSELWKHYNFNDSVKCIQPMPPPSKSILKSTRHGPLGSTGAFPKEPCLLVSGGLSFFAWGTRGKEWFSK